MGVLTSGRSGRGRLSGAFSLAGWEIRRTWPVYVLGGLIMSLCGFLAVFVLSGFFDFEGFGSGGARMEDFYNDLFADVFFLGVCASLAVNTFVRRDACSPMLLFLREMPVPAVSVVAGRTVCMLLALTINAPAFFLPAYFLTDFGELGTSYPWFVGVWVGYGLLASGFYLRFEFAGGGGYAALSAGFVFVSLVLVAVLEWAVDLGLVERTVEIVKVYGAFPAVISVLVGAVALLLSARATVVRLQRREVFAEPFA